MADGRVVARQLEYGILPYVFSAEKLCSWPPYRAYGIYRQLRGMMTALVGIGLAPPLLKLANQIAANGQDAGAAVVDASLIASLTPAAIAFAVLLVGLKVYFAQNEIEKRFVLAVSCRREFRTLHVKLHNAVLSPDLAGALIVIQNETASISQRHVTEESWPYNPFAKGIERKVKAEMEILLAKIPPGSDSGPDAMVDQV